MNGIIFFLLLCIFFYIVFNYRSDFLQGKLSWLMKKLRGSSPQVKFISPVTLDSAEIQHLGEEAAAWCTMWMHDSSADHKSLVIEVSRTQMDCRSVYNDPPYNGYPHCIIRFSKEIADKGILPVVQKILDIISVRCPEMISVYGLHLDGCCLILPTNGDETFE